MPFLFGAFVLAGTSVIAGRLVSGYLGTFTIAAASLFFALLALVPVCGKEAFAAWRQLSLADWLRLFLQALFGVFLFRVFLLQGLIRTTGGEAGVITGATPAVTTLLAWLVLKEKMPVLRCCGVVSTVMGVMVLQGFFSPDMGFKNEHLLGNLLVLCAALSESVFNVLSRLACISRQDRLRGNSSPVIRTALVVGISLLLCLGPALAEQPVTALSALPGSGWMALVWYGVFVTALAFVLWYSGIQRCNAAVAAAFSGMMPFTALFLSVVLLGEHLGWQQWLGGLLVIAGMLLVGLQQTDKRLRPYAENG